MVFTSALKSGVPDPRGGLLKEARAASRGDEQVRRPSDVAGPILFQKLQRKVMHDASFGARINRYDLYTLSLLEHQKSHAMTRLLLEGPTSRIPAFVHFSLLSWGLRTCQCHSLGAVEGDP